MWPVAIGVALRVALWALVPASRYASDEAGYVGAGVALATKGEQDLFWPPFTGWVIAAIKTIYPPASLKLIRFVWLLFDAGSLLAVRALARRTAAAVFGETPSARRCVLIAVAGYAVYLPAVSHAQFATSETPALLLMLLVLLMLTRPLGTSTAALAGLAAGALVLTRASLLPLVALLPSAALLRDARRSVRAIVAFVVMAAVPLGMVLARNYRISGELTLSRNAAYNLYIGNQDFYAEDLNLFNPRATAEQIEFRQQFFANTLQYPALSAAEMQRRARDWILEHPGTFARRALGRLARVFAPKTDVLELVGGESAAGVFSFRAILTLLIANAQWAVVLCGGILGLAHILRVAPDIGGLYLAAIAGSVLLCLVAISKPRYSFVFDPVLIIACAVALAAPRDALRMRPGEAQIVRIIAAFVAWGWVAWLIFAVTSRMQL